METKLNGYMTFQEAVVLAGLPRYYKGDKYVPSFFKNKIIVMLPENEEEQLYILKDKNESVSTT